MGLRPIAEIQYLDYLYYALQIMRDDLATVHYRSAGPSAHRSSSGPGATDSKGFGMREAPWAPSCTACAGCTFACRAT